MCVNQQQIKSSYFNSFFHKKVFLISVFFLVAILQANMAFSQAQPCATIRYSFVNQTNDINGLHEYTAVRSAIQAWSDTIHIDFVEESNQANADLLISWDTNGHLPANLSHSKYANFTPFTTGTSVGTISFNDYWNWTTSWQNQAYGTLVSQETMAMRYIGNILGAYHSSEPASVLSYTYTGSKSDLTFRDKDMIRKYYAHCQVFGEYRRGRTAQNLHDNPSWSIDPTDFYFSGRFVRATHSDIHGVKQSGQGIMLWESNNNWLLGADTANSASSFLSAPNTIMTTGDFDGDGFDEILYARPNGDYGVLKFQLVVIGNSHIQQFVRIQHATNGDIDVGDKLVSGDFNGDGKDDVLLVKANKQYFTMEFNHTGSAYNWDIIENGTNTIYWWRIGDFDHYVTGDFDGDGKDELLASAPNGWHHTMGFDNQGQNQWGYEEGSGNGQIGGAHLGWNDILLSGDFNGNGRDDILFINPVHSWSLLLSMSTGQWPSWSALSHNNGTNILGNWNESLGDGHLVGDFDGDGIDELFIYNGDDWQIITF